MLVHPAGCESERRYICEWLFREILGIGITLVAGDVRGCSLTLPGHEGEVTWDESVFRVLTEDWLKPVSLDRCSSGKKISCQWDKGRIGMDVPGELFLHLSRYEEAVRKDRDEHDRCVLKGVSPFRLQAGGKGKGSARG